MAASRSRAAGRAGCSLAVVCLAIGVLIGWMGGDSEDGFAWLWGTLGLLAGTIGTLLLVAGD